MPEHAFTNRLIHETSPYLLQHAHNPVDWYPWGEDAFQRAQEEDRPIFLSIGYATCHWCHRMEQESFEDPVLASLMNDAFVNIKVDREELPHVDSLYMDFAQALLGGGGGWPLNIILTPDRKPIFAATYLPPVGRGQQLGVRELVERIRDLWNEGAKEQLAAQAERIMEVMEPAEEEGEGIPPDESLVEGMAELYYQLADPRWGGMQGAPKFPMGYHLTFMATYGSLHQEGRALYYVEKSLDMMHRGGVYDHLGGGFSRYSVDETWLTPHFEKMLYDQAMVARAYVQASQILQEERYEKIAREILDYVLREMCDPEGGFYSAEDADSEGQEGLFYTWTYEEVIQTLGDLPGRLFSAFYGVTPEGNFEGRNILHQTLSIEEFAAGHQVEANALEGELDQMRHRLWEGRNERVHPLKDDKVIVAWNGLVIRSMAEAGFFLQEEKYAHAARKAAHFLKENLYEEGRLYRRWRRGEVGCPACLEDYTFLISGLLTLFSTAGEVEWLRWAIELAQVLTSDYKKEGGAFFRTDGSDLNLLIRQVDLYDGAEPSGNAVHAENLLRLYQLTGMEHFHEEAQEILGIAGDFADRHPLGATYHGIAMMRLFDRHAATLVIALNEEGSDAEGIKTSLRAKYHPHLEVIWLRPGEEALQGLLPICRDSHPIEGQTTLYLCRQGMCEPPVTGMEEIKRCIASI